MELHLPDGQIDSDPTEELALETAHSLDPNEPATVRLQKDDDDWVEVSIDAKGLSMRHKDPTTGLTLTSSGPYLSKNAVKCCFKDYFNGVLRWNMHVQWAPEGGKGGAKKKGCMGVILLALSITAAIIGTACNLA